MYPFRKVCFLNHIVIVILLLFAVKPIFSEVYNISLESPAPLLQVIEDDGGRFYPAFFGIHDDKLITPDLKNGRLLFINQDGTLNQAFDLPNLLNPRINFFKILHDGTILILIDQELSRLNQQGLVLWSEKLPLTFFIQSIFTTSRYLFLESKSGGEHPMLVWDLENGSLLGTFGSRQNRVIQTDQDRIIELSRQIDSIPLHYIGSDQHRSDYWFHYNSQNQPVIYRIIVDENGAEAIDRQILSPSDSGRIHFAMSETGQLYYNRIHQNSFIVETVEF